jgi:acyl-CoA reductase-like NAD-dependent aldehyde dehydrogenase
LKHLVDGGRALGVGDPMDERTVVGPLISSGGRPRDGMDRRGQGRRRGVLTGDRRTGNVVAPTLVELSEPKLHRLRVWSEEIFGPVATVEPINSFAEGVAAHQRFALRPAVKSVHR